MHLSGVVASFLPPEAVDTVADYVGGATDLLHVLQLQAKQLDTRFDLLGPQNQRLANRVALHLALGGGCTPPPTP